MCLRRALGRTARRAAARKVMVPLMPGQGMEGRASHSDPVFARASRIASHAARVV